jgi:hypothetical protein
MSKTFEEMFQKEEKEKEEQHWSRTNSGNKDCDHDMQYSSTSGVVGGICKKCGYKTY